MKRAFARAHHIYHYSFNPERIPLGVTSPFFHLGVCVIFFFWSAFVYRTGYPLPSTRARRGSVRAISVITAISHDPVPNGLTHRGCRVVIFTWTPFGPQCHRRRQLCFSLCMCRFKKERSYLVTKSVMTILRKHAVRVRDMRETCQVRVIS